MTPIDHLFWINAAQGLGAAATAAVARLGLKLFPSDRAGLVMRESLALPCYALAAALYVHVESLPSALTPLLAMALALAGGRRLAHLALRYILRK